jgi:DNA-binding response OmpR family regulator
MVEVLVMRSEEYIAEVSKLREENDLLRAEIYRIKQARVDLKNLLVMKVGLTPKEAAVLAMLVEAGGRFVSRDHIWMLWDASASINERIIDVHICNIRKKLKPLNMQILTIWGQGYSVCDETTVRLQAITMRLAA